jgi:dolichol-phosphate mannosyltransferase
LGRRGLASACIEGMLASPAPFLAVMDGDLQHDEAALLPMLRRLRNEPPLDLVVGSRYVAGGSIGDWDSSRSRASSIATSLAGFICKQPISDPMSGFFMIRRAAFLDSVRNLSAIGFKILLDLFASSPRPLNFYEQPYTFRSRREGESKFDNRAIGEYLYLLLDKSVGKFVPARFIVFSAVGATGVGVHMAILASLYKLAGASFVTSQVVATLTAMTFNYWLNNLTTYRDRRRRGWHWFTGWLGFTAACGLGAAANAGVASYIFETDHSRWALSALAGIAISAVWNYAVTSVYTWTDRARK